MVMKSVFQFIAPERVPEPLTVVSTPLKIATKPSSNSAEEKKKRSKSKKARHQLKALVAGSFAGATEITITYPIDYVKIQLQLDSKSTTPRNPAVLAWTSAGTPGGIGFGFTRFKGMLDCYRKTLEQHGVRGLYRGWNVAVLSPKTIVRFQAFEFLKKMHLDSTGHLSLHGKFLCGLAAGAMEAAFAVTPIESIKVKFIHDLNFATHKYDGFFQGIGRIIRKQGIRGIYSGLVPTVMKTSTNQAIRFLVVESLKDWRKKGNPRAKVSKPLTALFGAIGGIVSVFCNTPLDVIKSRMQGLEAHKYRSAVHCAYMIASNEGPKAFYKGTLARLMRTPMEVAITFVVYDLVMEFLHDYWEPHYWDHP